MLLPPSPLSPHAGAGRGRGQPCPGQGAGSSGVAHIEPVFSCAVNVVCFLRAGCGACTGRLWLQYSWGARAVPPPRPLLAACANAAALQKVYWHHGLCDRPLGSLHKETDRQTDTHTHSTAATDTDSQHWGWVRPRWGSGPGSSPMSLHPPGAAAAPPAHSPWPWDSPCGHGAQEHLGPWLRLGSPAGAIPSLPWAVSCRGQQGSTGGLVVGQDPPSFGAGPLPAQLGVQVPRGAPVLQGPGCVPLPWAPAPSGALSPTQGSTAAGGCSTGTPRGRPHSCAAPPAPGAVLCGGWGLRRGGPGSAGRLPSPPGTAPPAPCTRQSRTCSAAGWWLPAAPSRGLRWRLGTAAQRSSAPLCGQPAGPPSCAWGCGSWGAVCGHSPTATCTDTAWWLSVSAQRCRSWVPFTPRTPSSASFTASNSMPRGVPASSAWSRRGQPQPQPPAGSPRWGLLQAGNSGSRVRQLLTTGLFAWAEGSRAAGEGQSGALGGEGL